MNIIIQMTMTSIEYGICTESRHNKYLKEEISQAEYLESLLPKSANVVKAFNILSAYSLENGGFQGM